MSADPTAQPKPSSTPLPGWACEVYLEWGSASVLASATSLPSLQVPIHALWSDGRENLLGALLMAGQYVIPEVSGLAACVAWAEGGGVNARDVVMANMGSTGGWNICPHHPK